MNSQLLLPRRFSLTPESAGQLISSEPGGVITQAAITGARCRQAGRQSGRRGGGGVGGGACGSDQYADTAPPL